ncbi:MAG: NAD(P)-dependent oxidoreductase [Pseudomonadales bacterium]|nr:NAD(P)-dependent oxidoreductase [Pseudomonadales bacterium]
MKVLITGGCGNLGIMCVERALQMGMSVKCFDMRNRKNSLVAKSLRRKYPNENLLEFVWGDICHLDQHPYLLADVSGIIHNASVLPPLTDTNPTLAYNINVSGTEQLIKLAESQPQNIRFIFPSSVTVFGYADTQETPRSLSDPTKPTDQYTHHKLKCEVALQVSKLDWCILRVGVSVDHRTTKTDFKTLQTLLSVNAKNPLEYVHPKDVATAMCSALTSVDTSKKLLLIGGGPSCQVTQSEFLNAALDGLGLKLSSNSFGNNSYYTHWMNTNESQQLLDYQQHSFEDYKKEMADKFKTLRSLLTPIRPVANWFLNQFASRLSRA